MDHWAAAWALTGLAVWMLASGLDDLLIGLVSLFSKPLRWPGEAECDRAAERPIAILVPLWKEHCVIGRMLERNLAAIRYGNYEIFAGVYCNDMATLRAVEEIASQFESVHVVVVPHDGPTSKGDCLNAIYAGMCEHEVRHRRRFEILITHDAEDLVHPRALRLINWFSRDYEMVQIPVLALPTRLRELTHGLYCDEFAEYQTKDIPVRQRMGGFLPSNGVGTGFARAALEHLADTRGGKVFDPACLTEDYENGFALHALGYRQIFVPVRFEGEEPVATREYFPRTLRAAVRQRSRWVAGIALQGWQKHGWRTAPRQWYWFWRDRKGVAGNLLSPWTNVLFVCGLAGWAPLFRGPAWLTPVYAGLFGMAAVQVGFRVRASARIYGWRFAAGVPARMLWGNAVNGLATVRALHDFFAAARRNRTLSWRKTEHVYPAMESSRPPLGEVLVRMGLLAAKELPEALCSKPPDMRLGDYLTQRGMVSEHDLYRALSLQAGIPLGAPPADEVNPAAVRCMPRTIARRWNVLPYRVQDGQLHIAATDVPSLEMTRALAEVVTLELRFRLLQPADFRALARVCGRPVPEAAITAMQPSLPAA